MKAIGYTKAGPISDKDALIEFETDSPELRQNDLLVQVQVRGISVNPVDVKVRMNAQHKLLNKTAALLDNGTLIPTVNKHAEAKNVANLRSAHGLQESGKAIGKTVLDGFNS